MKLIFCPQCKDLIRLFDTERKCTCGKSWGKYLEDGLHAEYGGEALPVGINNFSFVRSMVNQPESGMVERFEAFIMPKDCDTMKKV